jgi:response regulator RpfG family c-di-GMP phosphodiesterase
MSEGKALPRVLCVDDEPMVLEGLKLHLRRRFEVVTAAGGAEAMLALAKGKPFAVVVTDMRMPGMDGAELLSRARAVSPDTVRILLTGHADFQAALAAVNEGQLFRFLTKPCPAEVMVATVAAAVEQHRLVNAERELLELTLAGAVKTLSEVLALSNPIAFGRSARLHRTVAALCGRLHVADRWPVEVAAQLSQLGCIQLQPALLEKLFFGRPLLPAESGQVARVPVLTDQLLGNIPRLEPVREILASQARRFDGADDPYGRVKGTAIPVGARLLKLAEDLDTLEVSGQEPAQAIATLQERKGAYDPELLAALAEEVRERTAREILDLPLAEVKPGMVLAADVWTRTGVLLVARGYTVSQGMMMRLQGMASAVKEPIRVVAAVAGSPSAG